MPLKPSTEMNYTETRTLILNIKLFQNNKDIQHNKILLLARLFYHLKII